MSEAAIRTRDVKRDWAEPGGRHDQLVRLELASGRVVQSRVDGTAGWRPGDAVRLRVVGPVSVLAPGG